MFEKCQTKVLRSRLAEHLENECSQRSVKCEHCEQEMYFAELEVKFFYTLHRQWNTFWVLDEI